MCSFSPSVNKFVIILNCIVSKVAVSDDLNKEHDAPLDAQHGVQKTSTKMIECPNAISGVSNVLPDKTSEDVDMICDENPIDAPTEGKVEGVTYDQKIEVKFSKKDCDSLVKASLQNLIENPEQSVEANIVHKGHGSESFTMSSDPECKNQTQSSQVGLINDIQSSPLKRKRNNSDASVLGNSLPNCPSKCDNVATRDAEAFYSADGFPDSSAGPNFYASCLSNGVNKPSVIKSGVDDVTSSLTGPVVGTNDASSQSIQTPKEDVGASESNCGSIVDILPIKSQLCSKPFEQSSDFRSQVDPSVVNAEKCKHLCNLNSCIADPHCTSSTSSAPGIPEVILCSKGGWRFKLILLVSPKFHLIFSFSSYKDIYMQTLYFFKYQLP